MTDGEMKAVFVYHGKGGANRWIGEKRRLAKRLLLFRSWNRQRLVVSLALVATLLNIAFVRASSQPAPVAALEDPGIIAYVRRSMGDIHLISPDGQYVVFERVEEFDTTSSLRIINRDGSGLHKLADDAGRPAWGQVPPPPTLIYLPMVVRGR